MGIREDNRTPDTRGKLMNFKMKQEMTRQDMKRNVNRDTNHHTTVQLLLEAATFKTNVGFNN